MDRHFRKTMIYLSVLVVSSVVFTAAFLHLHHRQTLFDAYRSKALTVAATTAWSIDSQTHENIRNRADESGEGYQKIVTTLRKIRDINRRNDIHVSYIYTMRSVQHAPDTLQFVVDAEESLENKSHVGDIYKSNSPFFKNIKTPFADENIVYDQWGAWVTAGYPIYKDDHTSTAMVGVDLDAHQLFAAQKQHLIMTAGISILALVLGLIISFFLARRLSRMNSAAFTVLQKVQHADASVFPLHEGRFRSLVNELLDIIARASVSQAADWQSGSTFARMVAEKSDFKRRKITVMFVDIRGFTSISDQTNPETVASDLERFCQTVEEVTRLHSGIVDKFMGDGAMILFGAKDEDHFQEIHAVQCAVEIQKRCQNMFLSAKDNLRKPLKLAIGISSGYAVVGSFGSDASKSFTAIGDTVNLAARLENIAKEKNAEILVSGYVNEAVKGNFETKALGLVPIRGRKTEVSIFELQSEEEATADKDLPRVG